MLALLVGVPMGVYTGIKRESLLARGFMIFSLIGVSLPTFLIGILLILVFAVHARLAAQLRPRRGGAFRPLEHRLPDRLAG